MRRLLRNLRCDGLGIALGVLMGLGLSWAPTCAFADDTPPASAEDVQFFEAKVRPLLVEHCHKCHGPAKQEGGLRLDSRAAVLKGGEIGRAHV